VVVHICNATIWESEAGASQEQVSPGYVMSCRPDSIKDPVSNMYIFSIFLSVSLSSITPYIYILYVYIL
jgi:hypothetical protein